MAKVMPAIRSVMAVNEGLKQTMQRYNALAGQVCSKPGFLCHYLRNRIKAALKQIL